MIPPGGDMFHVLVLALCTNAAGVLFLGLLWRALRSVRLKQARTDLPLSFFDTMTGMPNRHYFQDRISGVLSQGQGGAIVLIDLADFGNVNDRRGRTFGDAVIKELGLRLRVCADNADGLAARLGGDRFALYLPGVAQSGLASMCASILQLCETSVIKGGESLDPKVSLGAVALSDLGELRALGFEV